MATIKTQPVHADLGSQELAQLRTNYNNLVQVFGDLVTTIKSATLVADIVAAVTTAETALQNTVAKIGAQPNIPLGKAMPELRPGTLP